MESKGVKELNNRHRIVVDSKRKQTAQCSRNRSEGSHKGLLLRPKHDSLLGNLGKRKRSDGYESKCGAHFRKSSLKNYSDFMKSGLPQRVLFYQNGEWFDFPKDIVGLVREEFKLKNAAIEVRSNDCHFMLDILYMMQVDLKATSQKPIAWIDEAGSCFFPQLHSTDVGMYEHHRSELEKDEESVGMEPKEASEIKLHLQIELNGVNNCGLEECVEESNTPAKRIKIKQKPCRKDLELGANDDYNSKHVLKVEEVVDRMQKIVSNPLFQKEYVCEIVDLEFVRKMFLEGMKPSFDVDILDINKCNSNMMQTRWQMFQKQVELTQKCRGDPNIRYAWFGAAKDVLSSTMNYGFTQCGSKGNATYGLGVHLTSLKCAITSANYCDVDENGVQHMVFCRVILGNVELVRPGSTQFYPSSESFDNGVDDLQDPQHYIVWSMNMNTNIFPEYVVSFKMPHNGKAFIEKGCRGVPEVNLFGDHRVQGLMPSFAVESGKPPTRTPKSPYLPFSTLFDALSPVVSQDNMEKLYTQYEEMKNKQLSRQEFIMKLRAIVGDELLKTSILGLQSKFPEKGECVLKSPVGN